VAEFDAAKFDAELYLRLTGEQALLDRGGDQGQPWDAPLDAAAHALVAVGAMTAGAAQQVVDDYYLALSYRGDEQHFHHRHVMAQRSAATADPGFGPLRAVPCGRVIEQPWGQLIISYLVLSDKATILHVTMRPAPAPGRPVFQTARAAIMRARAGHRPGGRGMGGHTVGPGLPGMLTLTDDRGTTAPAGFSGGGSGTEWSGQFEARPPLAPETAWIEILGERIETAGEPPGGVEVWVEPVTEQDPARRYLWARLASVTGYHDPEAIEPTIGTLVAAGALAADDPVIGQARAAAAQHAHGSGSGLASHGPLPEPWRSLLAARGRGAGPVGLVVAGVVTPRFDGITAAVLAVDSNVDQFSADVELVPSVPHWHAFRSRVDEPILAWWAADDRGHHYLGRPGAWHSSDDRSGGQIEFWPGLDPTAAVLDIMPTTVSARAVIRVPLAWAEQK
jgi:hypothetical protein